MSLFEGVHFARVITLANRDQQGPADRPNLSKEYLAGKRKSQQGRSEFLIGTKEVTSLQQRLFKTGGRLIRHARYFVLQLAESPLTQRLFGQILGRIERLTGHPT